MTKTLTVRIPDDLHAALNAEAASAGVTCNAYATLLLHGKIARSTQPPHISPDVAEYIGLEMPAGGPVTYTIRAIKACAVVSLHPNGKIKHVFAKLSPGATCTFDASWGMQVLPV